jgi:hypothetical protein
MTPTIRYIYSCENPYQWWAENEISLLTALRLVRSGYVLQMVLRIAACEEDLVLMSRSYYVIKIINLNTVCIISSLHICMHWNAQQCNQKNRSFQCERAKNHLCQGANLHDTTIFQATSYKLTQMIIKAACRDEIDHDTYHDRHRFSHSILRCTSPRTWWRTSSKNSCPNASLAVHLSS